MNLLVSKNDLPSASNVALSAAGSITDHVIANIPSASRYTAGASIHDFFETKRFISPPLTSND